MTDRKRNFLPMIAGKLPTAQDTQVNVEAGNGPLAGYTVNYRLNLVNFDWVTWHNYEWENWVQVDALLQIAIGFLNIRGIWRPNTPYIIGETVIDPADTTAFYLCEVSHTSGSDFEVDKPLYWSLRENADAPVTSVFGRIGDVVAQVEDYEEFYVNLDGDIMSGDLEIKKTDGTNANLTLNAAFANSSVFRVEIDDVRQWDFGRNADRDDRFTFNAYDNTGAFISTPLDLRADGRVLNFEGKAFSVEGHVHVEADITDLDRVRAKYPYIFGNTFYKNDMVRDGDWTMIANKETTERAAPQLQGTPQWDIGDAPAWTDQSHVGVVRSGREWDVQVPVAIQEYQVWAPTLTTDTNYTIIIYEHPTGKPEEARIVQVPEPILIEDGWATVQRSDYILGPGTTFGIILDVLNSGSSASPGGTPADWSRQADSNNTAPTTGGWNINNANTLLRIHENTADAALIDMLGTIAGTEFSIVSTVDANQSVTYRALTGETYATNVYSWSIEERDRGPAGVPPVGTRCIITFDVPVAAATDYVQEVGGNPSPTSRGILEFDGVPEANVENDAFGVRVLYDEYTVSEDWELFAYSGTSGGGGGDGGDGSGASVTFGDTFPVPDPVAGSLHYLTSAPVGMYLRHDDGDSTQWISIDQAAQLYGDYVQKSGDTMTGRLDMRHPTSNNGIWFFPVTGQVSQIVFCDDTDQYRFYQSLEVDSAYTWKRQNADNVYLGEVLNNPVDSLDVEFGGKVHVEEGVFVNASASYNAHLWFNGSDGLSEGLLFYSEGSNQLELRKYSNGVYQNVGIAMTNNAITLSGAMAADINMNNKNLDDVGRIHFDASNTNGDYITWNTANGLYGYENGGEVFRLGGNVNSSIIRGVYNTTSGPANDVHVTTSGILFRSTSARKFKTDIRSLDSPSVNMQSGAIIDALQPVVYKVAKHDNNIEGEDFEKDHLGFIAEDVAAVFPLAAIEENYDDRAMVAMLIAEVQALRARVAELEAKHGT